MSHFEAIFNLLLSSAIFVFTPQVLAYGRLFPVSRAVTLLAVLAVYALAAPVLSPSLPLWSTWLAGMAAVFCVRHYREGGRERFTDSLRFWPVPVVLLMGFGCFLGRWDPPGVESAVLGAAARGLADGQTFSLATEGGAVTMLIALGNVGHWAPVERLVGFFTGLGAVLFIFTLASALGLWFERATALVAALIAVAIFAPPQILLAGGAAPVFFALTSGFCLLEIVKLILLRSVTNWERAVYALAISFGAYCEPTAFLVSHLVCLPAVFWAYQVCDSRRRFLGNIAGVVLSSMVLVFPALWRGRFSEPAVVAAGSWSAALAVVVALGLISHFVDRRARYRIPALFCLLLAVVLVSLASCGKASLSVKRAAEAMAVFALAMPVAWWVETFAGEWQKRARRAELAGFGVFIALALYQFARHLVPSFATPQLTARDRAAMAYVGSYLPAADCIGVDSGFAGRWIPTLTHRCVVSDGQAPWVYLADGQPRPPGIGGRLVYDGGAQVYEKR